MDEARIELTTFGTLPATIPIVRSRALTREPLVPLAFYPTAFTADLPSQGRR